MLKSGTRRGGIRTQVRSSLHSRGSVACGAPTSLIRPSRSTGLSFQRKLLTRPDDLPVLDEVDAVAGQAGEQQALGVDLADVPEAGQQQPALGRRDHLVQRGRAAAVHRQAVDVGADRGVRRRGPRRGCGRGAVSTPSDSQSVAGSGRPLSKTDDIDDEPVATANGLVARRRVGRVGPQPQAGRSEPLADAGAAAGRLKTVRPSRRCGRSRSSRGSRTGRRWTTAAAASRSDRPAGRATRSPQPRRRRSSASRSGTTTSDQSRVCWPTQEEPPLLLPVTST